MEKRVRLGFFIFILSFCVGQINAQEVEYLFNGKNLEGWRFILEDENLSEKDVFSVKDGVIHITGPLGYMYTQKVYANYHLEVEWRWPNGVESNSGIFLLIEEANTPFPNGIECQLHAGDAGDFVLLGGSDLAEFENPKGKERPAFPVVKKRKESTENKAGEWNKADIYCYNGVITVYINGVFQNKGTNQNTTGYIGLQSEGKDVQFRNVVLTPLP